MMKRQNSHYDALYHILTATEVPHEDCLFEYRSPESLLLEKERLYLNLGKNAREVVRIILEPEEKDLPLIWSEKLQRISECKLFNFLRKIRGWKRKDILSAFSEIKLSLISL